MERKLKHLEFVQTAIERMAKTSFLIKGWSLTLAVAVLTFAERKADFSYLWVAFLSVLIMWLLDGYFLAQERKFRKLYDEVRKKEADQIDFSMDVRKFSGGIYNWAQSVFSSTLILFYISNLMIMLVVAYLFSK